MRAYFSFLLAALVLFFGLAILLLATLNDYAGHVFISSASPQQTDQYFINNTLVTSNIPPEGFCLKVYGSDKRTALSLRRGDQEERRTVYTTFIKTFGGFSFGDDLDLSIESVDILDYSGECYSAHELF